MSAESFIQQIFENLPCARNRAGGTHGEGEDMVPALRTSVAGQRGRRERDA